ncbi:MAG TPA: hypothetical protein VNM14_17165 [Planctomycetota bacterium]|nr:hypothetical protein [Planctomycetota bacterium]
MSVSTFRRLISWMMGRLFLALTVAALGCSPESPALSPLEVLLPQITSPDAKANEAAMVECLRTQGKDPDRILGLPNYFGGYPLHVFAARRLTISKKPYGLIRLALRGFSVPGTCVERYLLLDDSGRVQDVVTVSWPSRLADRFDLEFSEHPHSGTFRLRLMDRQSKEFWGNFDPPQVTLHESGDASAKTFTLGWRGDLLLGGVAIEKDRFVRLPDEN